MLALGFAPRLLGVLDVLLRQEQRRRYGGLMRLIAGGVIDMLFSFFLGPLMMIAQSVFIAGLLFGRRVMWDAQNRDGGPCPWARRCAVCGRSAVRLGRGNGPGPLRSRRAAVGRTDDFALPAGRSVHIFDGRQGAGRLFVRFRVCAIPTSTRRRLTSSSQKPGEAMKYLHTMVRVTDLDASLDFYCNKLGLKEIAERMCRRAAIR